MSLSFFVSSPVSLPSVLLLEQVVTDLRQAEGGVKSEAERRRQQSQVLSAVFETYFRILKTTHEAANAPAPAPKTRCRLTTQPPSPFFFSFPFATSLAGCRSLVLRGSAAPNP